MIRTSEIVDVLHNAGFALIDASDSRTVYGVARVITNFLEERGVEIHNDTREKDFGDGVGKKLYYAKRADMFYAAAQTAKELGKMGLYEYNMHRCEEYRYLAEQMTGLEV